MMEFDIEQAIDILSRTPEILRAWLSDIPEAWGYCNEGSETWSAFDVVGHFIHGERTDWIPRAQLILSGDDDVPEFEPFDRFAQFEASKGKTLAELLAIFAELRAKNLEILRGFNLQPADFEREGKHPELGIVNLKQLLATWVVHDLDHLGQIGQVMARQYRDEVGPWGAYLTILEGA
jgi:hypothetical protein